MAIFRPGQRHRYHNILKRRNKKRSVTAMLSLTAMVDMFTVLVIFFCKTTVPQERFFTFLKK